MTSEWFPPSGQNAVAKYRATKPSKDVQAQASGTVGLQWVLMKDVDKASGYQTPSPPEQAPEYEGQIVVVPAMQETSAS